MSSPIFISYRRSDSQHATGRLFSRLAPRHVAPADIFMDVAAIAAGGDFVQALRRQLKDCKVCVVIIGPIWINQTDAKGHRRLDDPNDFVRLEVAEALERGITVIPVLVDNAKMPSAAELPAPLKALATKNAVHLVHERFDSDADSLAGQILEALGRRADLELDLLRLLFSFKGTISRRSFWIGILLVGLAQILVEVTTLWALGKRPLSIDPIALTAPEKVLVQIATLWVWWPNLALIWKRVRDLGHSWDLFLPILGAVLGYIVCDLAGLVTEANTMLIVCVLVVVLLGSLKGTRFIAHAPKA